MLMAIKAAATLRASGVIAFLLYTSFGSRRGDMPHLDPQRASSLCLGVSSLGLLQVEAARPEAALMDTHL
ncbi:unnamed protein product [Arctia plantaginis]|uniref:Uncharacterized protein n=1 Tax=Arctia plantaginis TaxID=874455 RepID=A0A8S0ZKJ2_ARCPL|nr:unnamed protein product [Arctia plantaginis]